jgi:hypothetical protein
MKSDALFRSWKIQQAILGFTPEEIRRVYEATKHGYTTTFIVISEIRRKHANGATQ